MPSAIITRFVAVSWLAVAACGPGDAPEPDAAQEASALAAVPAQEPACQPQRPTADRPSPYDSTVIRMGDRVAKVCYSRPSVRGREIFGGLVPYGQLWRTGANEPTTLHLPFAARIAGLDVQPGQYSIYTVPAVGEWTVIVNPATDQWGVESAYTAEIEAQELGRGAVPSEALVDNLELFTIRAEPAGENGANLIMEWERTRVTIPITAIE